MHPDLIPRSVALLALGEAIYGRARPIAIDTWQRLVADGRLAEVLIPLGDGRAGHYVTHAELERASAELRERPPIGCIRRMGVLESND